MRKVVIWESEDKIKEEMEKLEKLKSIKKQINIYKKVYETDKTIKNCCS